jgi:hypothetical protein
LFENQDVKVISGQLFSLKSNSPAGGTTGEPQKGGEKIKNETKL